MKSKDQTMKKNLKEVIRFVFTGGFCFLIEFASLVLLKELLHMDTLVATPIAFTISVIVNYLLCVIWVFPGTKDNGAAAKVGFVITSVIGLVLNEVLMLAFRLLWGEDTLLMTLFGFDVTNLYAQQDHRNAAGYDLELLLQESGASFEEV